MNTIKKITYQETFSVRHEILREGKPIETCFFEGDNSIETKHFGFFIDIKIIGVVSIYKNKSDNFNLENQFQIRGMAILKEFQKKGYGKLLVKHCENYLINNGANLIWFNARETAVSFYEKMGYKSLGVPFEITDVGIHFIMFKKI